jgi:hypothetical protein
MSQMQTTTKFSAIYAKVKPGIFNLKDTHLRSAGGRLYTHNPL